MTTIPRLATKSKSAFYLEGDLFLDINFGDHQLVSYMNSYKQIQSIHFIKELNSIYSIYEINPDVIDSHS